MESVLTVGRAPWSVGVGALRRDPQRRCWRRRSGRQQQALRSVHLIGAVIIGDPVKQRHRALGEIAAFGDRPLVVDLEEDRSGKAQDRRLVGEDARDVAPAFDLLVHPLERVRRPHLPPVADRKRGEGGHVLSRRDQHRRHDREAGLELGGDLVELLADGRGIGLGEDRADRGEDHLGAPFRDPGQDVPEEVDPAALPRRAEEDRRDRGLQALVGVADDEPDADEASRPQAAQEGRPERAVLGVPDREPQDLPVPARGHPGGDDDGLADHAGALMGLDVVGSDRGALT